MSFLTFLLLFLLSLSLSLTYSQNVQKDARHWTIHRRYSDFTDLHSLLSHTYDKETIAKLALPKKRFVGVHVCGVQRQKFINKKKGRMCNTFGVCVFYICYSAQNIYVALIITLSLFFSVNHLYHRLWNKKDKFDPTDMEERRQQLQHYLNVLLDTTTLASM